MGALSGSITLPGVGDVPKIGLIGVGAAAVGFIGWKYWQARNGTGADVADATDPGMEDPGTLPGVSGAVDPNNQYGSNTGDSGSDATGQILTNSQWSNDALAKLTQTGSYDAGAVAAALGNYLGSQPLSSDQQSIVRAAIAVSGYPPVGSFSIISGGNTDLTVAPTGLQASSVSTTAATVSFTAVPGATEYRIFRSGITAPVGASSSSPIVVSGLTPGTSYTVHVTAYTASGKASPASSPLSFKTAAQSLTAPAGLHSVRANTGTTTIAMAWNPVTGAKGYQILVNGHQNGNTVTYNSGVAHGLKKGTTYTVGVRAIGNTNNPGPTATISTSTKAK